MNRQYYLVGDMISCVETGQPSEPVRIGLGRTPRAAGEDLQPTPIQSAKGAAVALRWAGGQWDAGYAHARPIAVDDPADLDDRASEWEDVDVEIDRRRDGQAEWDALPGATRDALDDLAVDPTAPPEVAR